MPERAVIKRVEFRNFKAFEHFTVQLESMNILVGPNNAGKSTILDAFRVLAAGLRRANTKRAVRVEGPAGSTYGHYVSTDDLPISLENVHRNYNEDLPTTVVFHLSNKQTLTLYFAPEGATILIPSTTARANGTPSWFRRAFPLKVGFVPVLGPLEHKEPLVLQKTVQRNLTTHRAARNFRNYWYHFPDRFDEFAALVSQTWPGMELAPPEIVGNYDSLAMFCSEERIDREMYWAGFGFQVWCQLLTHVVRNEDVDLLIVDEPDIYLHPDMQRQILAILRDCSPSVLLATHSTEIIAEASPSELVLVDKARRSATRLRDTVQVQGALDMLGSRRNVALAHLALNQRLLFVEAKDFRILGRFARKIGLPEVASQRGFTVVCNDSFDEWSSVSPLTLSFEKALGTPVILGAVLNRGYRSAEEIATIKQALGAHLNVCHFHTRKELENYLLVPAVLERALASPVKEQAKTGEGIRKELPQLAAILEVVTEPFRQEVLAEYTTATIQYFRKRESDITESALTRQTIAWFEDAWRDLYRRMEIVPGRTIFSALNVHLQEQFGFTVTEHDVISRFRVNEVPADLVALLMRLNRFRQVRIPQPREQSR